MSTDSRRYPSIQIKYHPELLRRALNACTDYASTERYTRSVVFQALIMYAKESHDYGTQGEQSASSTPKVFPWVNVFRMAGDAGTMETTLISVTEAWNASTAAGLSRDSDHDFMIPSQARDAVLVALWTSLESHKRPFDEAAYLECLAAAKRTHASGRATARRQRIYDHLDASIKDATARGRTVDAIRKFAAEDAEAAKAAKAVEAAKSEAVTKCIDAVFAHFCPALALDEELADTFTTEFKAKRVLKTLSDAQR